MAASPPKITITKKLEADLRVLAEQGGPEGRLIGEKYINTARGVARQIIARIDDARERKAAATGMNPYDFVRMTRIGCPSVVVPMDLTGAMMGLIKNKITLLGLNEDTVERAAIRARQKLRQPMALSYFVKVIDQFIGDEMAAEQETIEREIIVNTGRGD